MSSKTTLLSRRQSLLAITCAAAFGPLALAGCGGGGGASGGNSGSSRRVSGKANLPANLVPRATQLRLFTGVDDTALAADGKFTVNTLTDMATIGTLMDGDKPVLIGFLGANAPSNVLDSGSCATVLLFIALGGQQIAPDQRQAFVSLIAGNTVTASLAQTIAERLAADPYALYNQDPQVAVALNAAVQALISTVGKAIRSSSASAVTPLKAAAASRGILQAVPVAAGNPSRSLSRAASQQSRAAGVRATDVTPLLLLAPIGLINGMEVVQDGDLQPGFSVINHQRRDRHIHLYRVGVVDQNDVETRYPAAVFVGDPLTVAATQKLNLANALGDVLSATSPWSPLQSSRVALPVQPNTHKTFYEIVALSPAFNQTEPAFFSEPRYAAEAPKWRAEVGDLNEAAYFELCFGLMLEALGMGALKYTDAALTESIANVKNVGGNDVASLLARARGGDPVGSSIIAFIQLVISSDTLSSRYLAAITPIYRIAMRSSPPMRS